MTEIPIRRSRLESSLEALYAASTCCAVAAIFSILWSRYLIDNGPFPKVMKARFLELYDSPYGIFPFGTFNSYGTLRSVVMPYPYCSPLVSLQANSVAVVIYHILFLANQEIWCKLEVQSFFKTRRPPPPPRSNISSNVSITRRDRLANMGSSLWLHGHRLLYIYRDLHHVSLSGHFGLLHTTTTIQC